MLEQFKVTKRSTKGSSEKAQLPILAAAAAAAAAAHSDKDLIGSFY